MAKPPIIHNIIQRAQTKLFCVEALELEFSNGTKTEYERLRSRGVGAVLIVPMRDPETVLMIHEWAAGTEQYELGLPKGRMEASEDMLDAANRELKEEIGFGAHTLTHLTTLTLAPGYMGHRTHIVLAEDLYEEQLEGDEPEPIEITPWSLNNLQALIARDDFSEARSLAALFLTQQHLNS